MLVIVVLCPVVGCITHFVIEYDIIIIKFLLFVVSFGIIWKRSLKLSVSYRVAYLAQSEHGLINTMYVTHYIFTCVGHTKKKLKSLHKN